MKGDVDGIKHVSYAVKGSVLHCDIHKVPEEGKT